MARLGGEQQAADAARRQAAALQQSASELASRLEATVRNNPVSWWRRSRSDGVWQHIHLERMEAMVAAGREREAALTQARDTLSGQVAALAERVDELNAAVRFGCRSLGDSGF
jgi:uncharacterized protein involved in exopolysaccharide biosynthesis